MWTNKNSDVPGAAVHTQTHDSWQCQHGPRPKSGPADQRKMRLCLKYTGRVKERLDPTQVKPQQPISNSLTTVAGLEAAAEIWPEKQRRLHYPCSSSEKGACHDHTPCTRN